MNLYRNMSLPSAAASFKGIVRKKGVGKKISTPHKLKRKCTKAMVTASCVLAYNITAIKAVIVVPMFAPMMNGAAYFNFVIRLATIGTTIEVVMVLDRMAAVMSIPQPKDLMGVLKKNLLNICGLPT